MLGYVYLIHFERPISPQHTTQHYTGYADDWHRRLAEHRAGQGARLTQVAVERGISFDVVAVWAGDRGYERRIKQLKAATRLCPICGIHHPQGRLHPPAQVANQLALVDADDEWPPIPPAVASAPMDRYELLLTRAWRQASARRLASIPASWLAADIPF